MPEPEARAMAGHQVLADPTGRRRRRLAIAGRVVTMALGVWLLVLTLGGLGLEPLAGLPIARDLGAGKAAPPALPQRIRAAGATAAPTIPAAQAPVRGAPVTIAPVPSRRPAGTAPPRANTRPPTPSRRPTSATPPGQTKIRPDPRSGTPKTKPTHSRPTTVPGQTPTTPPGQAKRDLCVPPVLPAPCR